MVNRKKLIIWLLVLLVIYAILVIALFVLNIEIYRILASAVFGFSSGNFIAKVAYKIAER